MPRGGPNLGKIACVIIAAPPHVLQLFVQRDTPLPNQQRGPWSHRWSWFPTTPSLFSAEVAPAPPKEIFPSPPQKTS